MTLSNVAIDDTFNLLRTRTNQLIAINNQLETSNILRFISNSTPLSVSAGAIRYGNVYFSLATSNNVNDISTTNIAAAQSVNTTYQLTRTTFSQANTGYTQANAAYGRGNTAYTHANNAYVASNTVLITAQAAYGAANTAAASGIPAFNQANAANITAISAFGQANSSNITAIAAFAKANTMGSNTSPGILQLATATEFRAGTNTARPPSVESIFSSVKEVSVASAATLNIDMQTGINFNVDLAHHATLSFTNITPGKSGRIRIRQTISGGNTMSYNAHFNFVGGTAPTLSTGVGNNDVLYWDTIDSANIFASLIKNEY